MVAGALLGFCLHRMVRDDGPARPVDVATRDRREPGPTPSRSHHYRVPEGEPAPAANLDGARDPERPGVGPPIEYAPRATDEWQGMLVNTSLQALCDTSERCGLAMACLGDRCGPCSSDDDCAAGEACAMQHCVVAALAHCRSRADCPGSELCMLTGYGEDPRGNHDLEAYCSGTPPRDGRDPVAEQAVLDAELAAGSVGQLATNDPGAPEGLLRLLQD